MRNLSQVKADTKAAERWVRWGIWWNSLAQKSPPVVSLLPWWIAEVCRSRVDRLIKRAEQGLD